MLDVYQLSEIEPSIREELNNRLEEILTELNRKEQLENFLELIGLKNLIQAENTLDVFQTGKIIVLGATEVKEDKLLGVAKELGIDKDRFEMHLTYDVGNCLKNLEYNYRIAAIMVGPLPHSGIGKDSYGSMISSMEKQRDKYAPVIRLGQNELKITKSDFKVKLQEMIAKGIIR